MTPVVVKAIGLDAYGFWSLLFVVLGWFGVHRMGLTGSVVTLFAREHAANRTAQGIVILRSGSTIVLAVALVLGAALTAAAPYVVGLIGTPPDLASDAVLAFRITTLATFTALVLGGYQSTLEALQEHPRVKLVEASTILLESALVLTAVLQGGGLVSLAVAYTVRLLLPIPVYAMLARRCVPGLSALPGRIDPAATRELLRFGGSMQALGVLNLAIASLDRLVLANVVSLAAAGVYELARKLVWYAGQLPSHALGPVVPATAERYVTSRNREESVKRLLRTVTRLVCVAGAVPLAFFFFWTELLVHAWLGAIDPDIVPCVRLLCVSGFLYLATGPMTAVLRGLATARLELLYTVVWLALAALLVPLGARQAGLLGAAAGSAAAQASASLLLMLLAVPALGLRRRTLLRDVAAPAVVASVAALLAAATSGGFEAMPSRWANAWQVALGAAQTTSFALIAVYWVVLDAEERAFLKARVGASWARRAPARSEAGVPWS
jgi:membrane protein EpsK